MIVQIYAFTKIEEALEAADYGVDQIGFVAGRYNEVHAELSFNEAAALVNALPASAKSSALTMSTELGEILRMAERVQPDIVHISTDTWAIGPTAMLELRRELPTEIELMKAIAVAGDESLETAQAFYPSADYLLLDTKVNDMPGVGATGRTHDWDISRQIVLDAPVPVILAGGLTPDNVAEAIAKVKPAGVDSNTGTNLSGDPVAKDMEKIKAFTRAARAAHRELA